jgi:hypothetical protein
MYLAAVVRIVSKKRILEYFSVSADGHKITRQNNHGLVNSSDRTKVIDVNWNKMGLPGFKKDLCVDFRS